jgi:hypothetical protein
MSLKRKLERANLKNQVKSLENVIRNGSLMNHKLHAELMYNEKNFDELQAKLLNTEFRLDFANKLIMAMAVENIRNHNVLHDTLKKHYEIPLAYVLEIWNLFEPVIKVRDEMVMVYSLPKANSLEEKKEVTVVGEDKGLFDYKSYKGENSKENPETEEGNS